MSSVDIVESSGLDANLLTGQKKKSSDAMPPVDPLPRGRVRLRKMLRITGYVAIALSSLVFFFLLKLPADLIGRNTLALLSQNTPYEWKADKTSLNFLFGPSIRFENMQIIQRFPSVGTQPQRIRLEKVSLRPNIFQMIPIPGLRPFTPAASFSVEAFQGELSGNIKMGASMAMNIYGESLSLDKMDFLKQNFNLNIKGKVDSLKLQFEAPQSRMTASLGSFQLQAKAFQFDPSSLSQGMPIPNMDIGPISLQASIKNGRLNFDKFSAGDATKDLELLADGQVQLKDPLDYSDMDLHFRLKLSEKLSKAAPTLESMLPIIAAKRPDGFYGTKISGPLMSPAMPSPYLGN